MVQYLLYGPVVWKVAEEWREQGAPPVGSCWLHLLLLFVVRGLTYQLWFSYGNMLFFTRRRRVVADAVDFRQVDAEWDWDNFLLLQTLMGATVLSSPARLLLPGLKQQLLCMWDPRGWAIAMLLHVAFSEPVFTGPTGHSTRARSSALPPARPSLRPRHHAADSWIWDASGVPADDAGDGGPTGRGIPDGGRARMRAPDFVFLAHVVDMMASMHVPFVLRSCSSTPFGNHLALLPFWPVAFAFMLLMWCCSKTFLVASYRLRGNLHQTWTVPRYGFQYFIPAAKKASTSRSSWRSCVPTGWESGCSASQLSTRRHPFVKKHPDLRVRVVHGNTLTAAVILNEIPSNVKDVFLTGATSKLGRAIALYLCRKKIRVLMLTMSSERFLKIQRGAGRVPAASCADVAGGKWLSPREQRWAGGHALPPVRGAADHRFRRDCTYGKLAAMRLPKDFIACLTRMAGGDVRPDREAVQYTMERGVVHACHAGGVVHFLEGWDHHEVGAIEVGRIDVVWKAALKHGFTPA
ncbi:hypothetical protein GUJ93_ZPchr1161g40551 [Zizania palustris]|uniref:Very-long-chain aldehyde decarbonylase CER1-like C-terminal domain-containing protein n=1 Tax=Zizania palustris TaxID=103762 RepID=A0A8J5VC73_ZIZPA|nr:hypothetical protein GUJ93_ZPchr1161g40551 [Zizania palustris]